MADTEREIYETPDSPVAESITSAPPEYESEYVSHDHLEPSSARTFFDRTEIDNARTNFAANRPVGWRSTARLETRQEKLNRLRQEITELQAADGQSDDANDLLHELESLNLSSSTVPAVLASSRVDDQSGSLNDIESRLAVLEIRISDDCLDVPSSIELLDAKVQLLTMEPSEIEVISRKLYPLRELAKSKELETLLKVNDMYESLQRTKTFAPILRSTIERLRDLKDMHTDAAEVYQANLDIAERLTQRQSEINDWKSSLKHLEEQVSSQETTTKRNVDVIQTMVSELRTD